MHQLNGNNSAALNLGLGKQPIFVAGEKGLIGILRRASGRCQSPLSGSTLTSFIR